MPLFAISWCGISMAFDLKKERVAWNAQPVKSDIRNKESDLTNMEKSSNRSRALAKRVLYGLLCSFIFFCGIGFFEVGGKVLLGSLVPLLLFAIFLAFITPGIEPKPLRNYLWLTLLGALGFTAGVAYGIMGIWGWYEVDNKIYLGSVMLSWAAFLLGLIESFVHLRKARRKEQMGDNAS